MTANFFFIDATQNHQIKRSQLLKIIHTPGIEKSAKINGVIKTVPLQSFKEIGTPSEQNNLSGVIDAVNPSHCSSNRSCTTSCKVGQHEIQVRNQKKLQAAIANRLVTAEYSGYLKVKAEGGSIWKSIQL